MTESSTFTVLYIQFYTVAHESIQILTTESFYEYIIRITRSFEISLAFIRKARNPTYLLFPAKICIILQEMIDC